MNPIEKYFTAEKYESLLFVLVGIIALFIASYFLTKVKQSFYTGIAYPLIAIAAIQLVVGSSVYIRSPKDIVRVNQIIQSDYGKIQSEEIPRMKTVMKNFELYRRIEIVLVLTGILLFFLFSSNALLKGIGLGLAIESALTLLLDFFAESRGKVYLSFLQNL